MNKRFNEEQSEIISKKLYKIIDLLNGIDLNNSSPRKTINYKDDLQSAKYLIKETLNCFECNETYQINNPDDRYIKKIKQINMLDFYNLLCVCNNYDCVNDIELWKKLYEYCVNIEKSKEFKDLFFFCDIEHHYYLYELKNEVKIKDFLKKHFEYEIKIMTTEKYHELLRKTESYAKLQRKFDFLIEGEYNGNR